MPTKSSSESTSRLETRVSSETKALFQKAADIQGVTLTDFVTTSVYAEATRVIEQHQTLKLSIEDSEALVEALLNPPEPNNALKTAFSTYEQVISIDAI